MALSKETSIFRPDARGRGIADAQDRADEAAAIAEATDQHFWTDERGVHVTQAKQDDFLANPTGANQLSNSNGILLRDGEANMAAFTPSSVSFFDGQGNQSENVTATFGADGATIGREDSQHVTVDSYGVGCNDPNGLTSRIGGEIGEWGEVNGVLEFGDGKLMRDRAVPSSGRLPMANSDNFAFRSGDSTVAWLYPDGVSSEYLSSEGVYIGGSNDNLYNGVDWEHIREKTGIENPSGSDFLLLVADGTTPSDAANAMWVDDGGSTWIRSLDADSITIDGEPIGGGIAYTLSKSGSTITLDGDDGSTSSVTDENATYSIGYTASSRVVKLTGANGGSSTQFTMPNATASASGLLTASLFSMLSATDNWIVETGTNSDSGAAMQWRWLKFDNGSAIAWGYRSASLTATTTWGSMYYSTYAAQNAPFTWAAAPYEWATFDSNGYFFCLNNANATTTKTGTYYAVCPTKQSTARSVQFTVLQIGRWK